MTRVLFVQDSGINESLALTEVSALLRRSGHSTRLLLTDEARRPGLAIRRLDPDLVVIPCPVAGHEPALQAAALVKRFAPAAVVILGGTHATFTPEMALRSEVDAVLLGEAESPVLEVADRIDRSRSYLDVGSLAVCIDGELVVNPLMPLVEDLDSLPQPDRELYFRYDFVARLPWKKFTTGRGCVHSCTYCWNTALEEMTRDLGRFVRRKSPQRAIDEILAVRRRWPLRRVHFSDDLFTVHPTWLDEFAWRYKAEVGSPFTCNTSVQLASPRAVEALRRAGCSGVAIGVETGNESLRAQLLGKPITNDEIRAAAAAIKGAGMELYTFNMVGAPGETIDDVLETIELNRSIGADRVRVNIAVPLAHTKFEETAFSLGVIDSVGEEMNVGDMRRPELQVHSADRRALVNLYLMFRAGVHQPVPRSVIRWLAEHAPNSALLPLRIQGIVEEKGITGLGWVEGLRFFSHVGDPRRRTANYVTLI